MAAPKYVAVTTAPAEHRYVNLDRVAADVELSKQVLNDEVKRAIAALERARAVSDVLDLRDALETVLARLVELRRMAA